MSIVQRRPVWTAIATVLAVVALSGCGITSHKGAAPSSPSASAVLAPPIATTEPASPRPTAGGTCTLITESQATGLIGKITGTGTSNAADEIAATATKVDVCNYTGIPLAVGYAVGKFDSAAAATAGMSAEAAKQSAKRTSFTPTGLTPQARGFSAKAGPVTLVIIVVPVGPYGVVTIASGPGGASAVTKAAVGAAKILLGELQ